MRVATWNLWWRFGDWAARRTRIRTTLEALDADVIGLQEVWHTEEENLAAWLAEALDYRLAFVASPAPGKWQARIDDDTVGIGNAVLSRWPITASDVTRLPAGDALDEGRVALHTTVATPHGDLPFTTTHVNSAWGQSVIRTEQLRAAVAGMDRYGRDRAAPFPPILCGDFNAMDDFDEIRALSGKREPLVDGMVLFDAWPSVNPDDRGWTWDRCNPHVDATNEPSARIDYLFVGPPPASKLGRPVAAGLFGTEPIDDVWPSDHFGVWVDLIDQPAG